MSSDSTFKLRTDADSPDQWLKVFRPDGHLVFTMDADGFLTMGPGVQPDEAAIEFRDALFRLSTQGRSDHAEIRAAIDAATTDPHHIRPIDHAALVANAPTWLAELLDECERLRATIEDHDDLHDIGIDAARCQRDQARADLAKWQKAVFEKEAARTAAEGQARIAQRDLDAANARLMKVRELADQHAGSHAEYPTISALTLPAALDSKGDKG